MAYQRKTADEYDLEGDYGQGWEILTCEATFSEAVKRRKEYRENGDFAPMRIKCRRVPLTPTPA